MRITESMAGWDHHGGGSGFDQVTMWRFAEEGARSIVSMASTTATSSDDLHRVGDGDIVAWMADVASNIRAA